MGTFLFFLCVAIIACIYVFQSSKSKSEPRQQQNVATPKETMYIFDSLALPETLSEEEKCKVKDVATFSGKRFVTGNDIKEYIIHTISADFAAMQGWNMWDASIHKSQGQYDRLRRAATDRRIKVLWYVPTHHLAKIQGKSGVYLTSYQRCSCPDYRKRRLPCKHMYALAMELNGDVANVIKHQEYAPLYGLTFALAGRFSDGRGKNEIRLTLAEQGGTLADYVSIQSAALVTGSKPSEKKIAIAKSCDMEILPAEMFKDFLSELRNEIAKG